MKKKLKSNSPSNVAACDLPPYDEWRKLPPDEAARILAKARGLDAEQEGLIAAILEHFREENETSAATGSERNENE
jgi:hypothetical protein